MGSISSVRRPSSSRRNANVSVTIPVPSENTVVSFSTNTPPGRLPFSSFPDSFQESFPSPPGLHRQKRPSSSPASVSSVYTGSLASAASRSPFSILTSTEEVRSSLPSEYSTFSWIRYRFLFSSASPFSGTQVVCRFTDSGCRPFTSRILPPESSSAVKEILAKPQSTCSTSLPSADRVNATGSAGIRPVGAFFSAKMADSPPESFPRILWGLPSEIQVSRTSPSLSNPSDVPTAR